MYAKDKVTVVDRREMLKVKAKSLAAEARIIRNAEQRASGVIRDELSFHRTVPLRSEARATALAYGFVKGRTYSQMEAISYTPPNWTKIKTMMTKYGQVAMTKIELEAFIKKMESEWVKAEVKPRAKVERVARELQTVNA